MTGPRDPNEIEEDIEADEGTDAGSIDDEGGDDAETGQESQEFEAEERLERGSGAPRAQRRDTRIADELRAEREHRAAVERELQELRREREQRQQPQEETEDQFQARIALLEPNDQWNAKFERSERRNAQRIALATFAAADRADKAAFDSKANSDPLYRKYAQEVERVLDMERRKGKDFDRETVLDFVIGRSRRMNRDKPNPAREQGKRNIERQQARTTGGRGDQQPQQRQPKRYAPNDMSPEAVRSRLEQPDAYI